MKCLVTGVETNNKWKNFPLCKEVVELAKGMKDEEGFKGCSQRERIIILKQRWDERAKEQAGSIKRPEPKIAVVGGVDARRSSMVHAMISTMRELL